MSQTPEDPIRVFAAESEPPEDTLPDEPVEDWLIAEQNADTLGAAIAAWSESHIDRTNLVALTDLDRERLRVLRSGWEDLPEEIRITVVSRAADLQDDTVGFVAGRFFTFALDDPSPQVRTLAVSGLAEEGDVPTGELILDRLLHDESNDVRAEAAAALEAWATQLSMAIPLEATLAQRIVDALLGIARTVGEPWFIRGRALESAAVFQVDARVLALVDEFYSEDEEGLRYSAIYAMGNSGDSRWLPILLSELDTDDTAAKEAAADALGLISDPQSIPALRRLIEDETTEVRHAAIRALGHFTAPAARRILNDMAEDPLPEDASVIQDALDLGLDDDID